ncbi:MAG: tRNA (adenosine(37)-N6)-threonylcarbamoyltransferase complex ATPase subunit type 1 TsaE [Lachnospiraceae bacterium]|nr:tRNA (adenosine(37)-N6)-threonylcarbamoyltransferase complex ATPase subunit type 1 TsaE [Lachnospiraceae bacterium]
MLIETHDRAETFALGKRLGEAAVPGQIIALTGDLGAGKTTFTQGFAAGLGITEPVTSPTFTIMQIYEEGRLPLYHFDVYRIEEPEEMDEIGYEEAFFGDGVSLVEWADVIPELMPPETIRIDIRRVPSIDDSFRRITITPELTI